MAKSVYQILVELKNQELALQGLQQIGQAAQFSAEVMLKFSENAAKAAADYEFSLTKIETVASAATGTIEQFEKGLAGLSDQLGNSASKAELAAASYDVLSSGYTEQVDVLGILEKSQKAAVGGFSDIAKVSDGVTSVMNSYGDALLKGASATEKAAKITDILIQTQNAGKITVDEYVGLIGNIAPTAAIAGVSLDELSAAIATTTANGLNASSSVAGLNQVIAAITKPTAQAVEVAAKLGIQFDEAALKSKGLAGVLDDITRAGGDNIGTLSTLFGSVEAVKVAANLTGQNLEKFKGNIQGMTDSAGLADKAFEKISDTMNGRAQAAINKLNNALVDLGRGVVVAIEPAINALTFLVENFNKLPDPVKQAIGLFTVVAGVTLTTAGAITFFTISLTTASATLTTMLPMVTSLATSLLASGAAAATSSAGFAALSVSMLPLTATVLAVAAAIGTLAAAWVYWDSLEKERAGAEVNAALQGTQALANEATAAAEKIRATGKALPDAEYKALINNLKAANDEYGSLTGVIEALSKVQEQYKAGVKQVPPVIKAATKSAEDQAKASKEIADALTNEITKINQAKEAKLAAIAAEVAAGLDRKSQLIAVRAAEAQANNDALNQLRQRLATEGLIGDDRARIEKAVIEAMKAEAQSLSDFRKNLDSLDEARRQSLNEAAISRAKLAAISLGANDQQVAAAGEAVQVRFLERSIANSQKMVETTKAGTLERAQAEADYYDKLLQLAELNRSVQTQAEADLTKVKKDALDAELSGIENLKAARQSSLDQVKETIAVQKELLDGTTGFLDGTSSLLSQIASFTKDENISADSRNQALGVAASLYGQLSAIGIDIQRAATAEQQIKEIINAIELEKLKIKRQELEIAKEIAVIETASQQADVQAKVSEAQTKLNSGTLNDQEAAKAQLEVQLGNQKLEVLGKQLDARQRSLDLQLKLNEAERQFQVIKDAGEREAANKAAPTSSPTGAPVAQQGLKEESIVKSLDVGFQNQIEAASSQQKAIEGTTSAVGKLEETQRANLAGIKQAVEASQTKTTATLNEGNQKLSALNTSANRANQTASQQLQAIGDGNTSLKTLSALVAQDLEVSKANNQALLALPGRIASLIPRAAAAPR